MSAEGLVEVLKEVAPFDHPWADADAAPMEDAALLRPQAGPPLAFTVDFITPIVDEPEAFGAIAAANALSDVYAMGGVPQVALAVCGFPEDLISREVVARIFRGGRDKAAEAGCAIVGGHTILDPELKYGLCVLGTVDPSTVLSQKGARPGDRLVLTKPIGAGVAAQAIKQELLSKAELAEAIESMTALNRAARDAAIAVGATAATDVTGFGLLGHLHNLLVGSGCGARIDASAVPLFSFARRLAEQACVPGGSRRNLEYVAEAARFADSVDETTRLLLADAQTSGGLLLCVEAQAESRLQAELERLGASVHASIGEVVASEPGRIEVV